jgi:hypothetical protein
MDKKRLHSRIAYLLRDEFSDTLAAGSVNGTPAIPGPGTRAVTDVANKISIGSGVLDFATGEAVNDALWLDAVTRLAGKLICYQITPADTDGIAGLGVDVNQSGGSTNRLIFAAGGVLQVISNSEAGYNLNSYTATSYKVVVALRTTGMMWFIKGGAFTNWTLIAAMYSGVTTPVYPNVQALGIAAIFSSSFLRVPRSLWLPAPLASDGMTSLTVTDGAGHAETTGLGSGGANVPWSAAATWSIAAGLALNTPVALAEMWDAAAAIFTAGTYAWVAYGGNTISNDGNALKVEYIDTANGAVVTLANASDLSADLVVGTWYRLQCDTKVNAGSSVNVRVTTASENTYTEAATDFTTHVITFRATHATTNNFRVTNMAAGEIVWVDNISLKPLTNAELFRPLATSLSANVVAQVKIAAIPYKATQVGLAVRLDDPTNPTSGIVAYFNNAGSVDCWEFSGATWTLLFTAAKAFVANDSLQLIVDGANVRLIHLTSAGVATLIGSTAAASVTTGGYHGLFSTDSGNTLDNFVCYPRGTANEYNLLDKFTR